MNTDSVIRYIIKEYNEGKDSSLNALEKYRGWVLVYGLSICDHINSDYMNIQHILHTYGYHFKRWSELSMDVDDYNEFAIKKMT